MNCEILSTLYIRSNGDIACNDDAGEKIILATISDGNMSLRGIFKNPRFTHIWQSFRSGKAPWPGTCPSCAFFRPQESFYGSNFHSKIRKVQIEPSLACNLRCPCCSQAQQITERPKPFLMKAAFFERFLGSIRAEGFRLGEIEYCGQGDPLMNSEFPKFVRLARDYFPATRQRLITNGNFDYFKSTGGQAIDEIFVSCDGRRQKSYEQYRVFGNVDLALNFMRAIPKRIRKRRQLVVWKYILFEFNDSDEEIFEAQNLAQELKVDTLLFVYTHSKFKSQRYSNRNSREFPIHYPNVRTNATPIHYQTQPPPKDRSRLAVRLGQGLVRILGQ